MKTPYRLIFSLFVVLLWAPIASAVVILPSDNAVTLEQLDFRSPFVDSLAAEITIDIASANAATGLSSGFINVTNGAGDWLVRNLPLFDASVYDHPTITTGLDLGVANGTDVSTLDLFVDYSSSPTAAFGGGAPSTFSVDAGVFAVGGFVSAVTGFLAAPDPSVLAFTGGGLVDAVYQKGHPNLEAADNQCAPMSVANSFQWLEDNTFLKIPHDHKSGLKGDATLVGQLDDAMGRGVRSRRDGDPLGAAAILEGKLEYISDNGLGTFFDLKHQGLEGGADFTRHGLTSAGKGSAIDFKFIFDELAKGEDLELGYLGPGGGHFVEVTGAGRILGVPWITYVSDHDHTDDTKGTGKVDFSFLSGTRLVNEKDTPDIALVLSQSAVPEPSTFTILSIGLLGLLKLGCRREGGCRKGRSR